MTIFSIIPSQQIYAQTSGTLWTPVHNLKIEVVSTDISQQPYRPYGTIAADINGAVHVFLPVQIWNCLDTLYYWRYDGSWTHPVDIHAAPPGQCIQFPEAVIDTHGTIHFFWMQAQQLHYSRSSAWEADSPHSWSDPEILVRVAPPATRLDVDLDHNGKLHLVYGDVYSGIYYFSSSDGGHSWSDPSQVSPNRPDGNVFTEPRIAVDDQIDLHVTWSEYDHDRRQIVGADRVMYARAAGVDSDTFWQVMEVDSSRNPTYEEGNGPIHINVISVGDHIHLVWDGAPRGQRHHQWSNNKGQNWYQETMIFENFRGRTGFNDMQIDASGDIHLVTGGQLAGRTDQAVFHSIWDGSNWSPLEVAIDGLGEDPRLAVTEGNLLHLIDNRGRYSSKQTTAKYISPQEFQTQILPEAYPTSVPTIHAEEAQTPNLQIPIEDSASDEVPNSVAWPIALASFSVVLIIGLTLFFHLTRRN